ncbi:hypothetical protein LCGC14_2239580 [marine sediment metagenome]|uniref:DUF721 domain-containing protein n=1 Tax=marine sediment metagenome TaxID=412755 RepID=A0A0F9G0V0_9ZZZZ
MDESQLRHVWQNRQRRDRITSLAMPLAALMKHRLARRVKQIGHVCVVWDECIPEYIREHTALVGFSRGTLTVAVDSAAHRYQLQQLLRSGLQQAIRERLPQALNRVKLTPGNFDAIDMPDRQRPRA